MQHGGAQALADQPARAVIPIGNDGEAHHLRAAASHSRAARQARQRQRRADRRAGNGQRQRHAHSHGYQHAHQERLQVGRPLDKIAYGAGRRANGGRAQHGQTAARQDGHRGRNQDVHLGFAADKFSALRRNNRNDINRQRAARAAQAVGRHAHGDQAVEHQLRGAERRSDGHRHRRPGHLLGKIARVNQKLRAQLLPQGFDNRADQKRGKQPMRHRAHRVHAVALGGKQHVFAFQKCLNPVHRFLLVLLFFQ